MIELSEESFEVLVDDLLRRTSNKVPSSFLRFNDGEGKVSGCPDFYSGRALVGELRTHFGTNLLTNESFHALRTAMNTAFQNADWIGIPPSDWPPLFTRARDVLARAVFRGEPIRPRLTHVSFPQSMFEAGVFDKLLTGLEFLGLIGCRDLRSYFGDHYGVKNCKFIGVPEQGTASYAAYLPPHYPRFADAVVAAVNVPFKGAIFLVGAGFCGKLYCEAIKKKGGIAIDVGSLLDLWAGRFTRPYMKLDNIVSYYVEKLNAGDLLPETFHAVADWHKSMSRLNDEAEIIDKAIACHPTSFPFVFRKTDVLLRLNLIDDAEKFVRSEIGRSSLAPVAIYRLAKLFLTAEIPQVGLDLLVMATNADPTCEPALIELANFRMGSFKSSNPDPLYDFMPLMECASVRKDNYQILSQYARILGSLGRYQEAIDLANRAADSFSYDGNVYEQKAAWERVIGRHLKEGQSTSSAVRLQAADNPHGVTFEEAVVVATKAAQEGQHKFASELWSTARRFMPDNVSLLINELNAYCRLRDFAAANRVAEAAMRENAGNYRFAQEWCNIADTACDWAEAIRRRRYLKEAYSLPLNTAVDVIAQEARTHLELGNYDEAHRIVTSGWPSIVNTDGFNVNKLFGLFHDLGELERVEILASRIQQLPAKSFGVNSDYLEVARRRAQAGLLNRRMKDSLPSRPRLLSIGQNCLPFQVPLRWGLTDPPTNETITPFDLGGHIANTAASIIADNFQYYLADEFLDIRMDGRGIPVAFHKKYGFGFFHERGPAWLENGATPLKNAYRRRIENFQRLLDLPNTILFFCLCGAGDIQTILELLDNLLNTKNCQLFVLNVLQIDKVGDIVGPRVTYHHVPYPRDYNWAADQDINSEKGFAFEEKIVELLKQAMGLTPMACGQCAPV